MEHYTEYINLTWFYWALMIAYGATIIAVVAIVLSENRNPVKSLAWVTVLLALPAFGLLLYFFFGRSFKNKRYISKANRRRLKKHEPAKPFRPAESGLSPQSCQAVLLAQSLSGSPYYKGNSARYFDNGSDKFDSLIKDISSAKKFVYLEYYIFTDQEIARRLANVLVDRVQAGVEVKIIYDYVGSIKTSRKFFRLMRKAGIEAQPYMKVQFPYFRAGLNWRNHRKIAIIDGEVGYIGGMNVADRYVNLDGLHHWRDLHLRVKGPIIHSLLHQFASDWVFMGNVMPLGVSQAKPKIQPEDFGMQLLTSGPIGPWSNIALEFQKMISSATRRVWIQTPYFLPNESLLRSLQMAALSKVDVRLMIPRRSDSQLLRFASYSFIKEVLQSGVKVYFYEPGMLHSKLLIVDEELVTVGSTNFDFRSFEHNFESNMFIYSEDFNQMMSMEFERCIEKSQRILPYNWALRPRRYKVAESITRLLSPIL